MPGLIVTGPGPRVRRCMKWPVCDLVCTWTGHKLSVCQVACACSQEVVTAWRLPCSQTSIWFSLESLWQHEWLLLPCPVPCSMFLTDTAGCCLF